MLIKKLWKFGGFSKNRHIFHNHIFNNHDFANQIFQDFELLKMIFNVNILQ